MLFRTTRTLLDGSTTATDPRADVRREPACPPRLLWLLLLPGLLLALVLVLVLLKLLGTVRWLRRRHP